MDRYQFNRRLAEAAREMAQEHGTTDTLERAVQMATEMLDLCDLAGISLVHGESIDTPAASDEALRRIDELQYEMKQGPCLDALQQVDVVVAGNLADDERWPDWGPRIAEEVGVHSSMSFRLFVTERNLGALNLYSRKVDAFGHEDVLEGLSMAAHAAIALAASLQEDQLHQALDSRRTIGEAVGILRERYGLTSEQAWGVLRRVSSTENVKLHQVARHLVDTGNLAGRVEPPGKPLGEHPGPRSEE